MSQEPHVSVQGLGAVYETAGGSPLVALSGIDLRIERGEFVSILGPSGCGKSTLLRIVAGLQQASTGSVTIDGRPPHEAQRTKSLGVVFQDPSLLPWRSVIDNVRLPLQVNRAGRASTEVTVPERLIDTVGLGGFERYYPHQLSGGMQQRVAIARALVTAPDLLLMDEPFGALDEITRAEMGFELQRVRGSGAGAGCTVIFVTHSIAESVLLSDRVVVLSPRPGRIAGIVEIDLPRPRDEEVELSSGFLAYTKRLRDLLREPVRA